MLLTVVEVNTETLSQYPTSLVGRHIAPGIHVVE